MLTLYSDESTTILVEKIEEYLEDHEIFELLELLAGIIAVKQQAQEETIKHTNRQNCAGLGYEPCDTCEDQCPYR